MTWTMDYLMHFLPLELVGSHCADSSARPDRITDSVLKGWRENRDNQVPHKSRLHVLSTWCLYVYIYDIYIYIVFTPLRGRVRPHQGHKVSYAQAGLFDLACAMNVLL